MPRIAWVEDADAEGLCAEIYTDEQVQALREVGWTDAQIAEAVYVGALFNLFVRLADAFDIHPDPLREPNGVPSVLAQRP